MYRYTIVNCHILNYYTTLNLYFGIFISGRQLPADLLYLVSDAYVRYQQVYDRSKLGRGHRHQNSLRFRLRISVCGKLTSWFAESLTACSTI